LIVIGRSFPPLLLKFPCQHPFARWLSTVRVWLTLEPNFSERASISLSGCPASEKVGWRGQASCEKVARDRLLRRDASEDQLPGNKPLPEEIFQPFNSPILTFFVSSVLGVCLPRWT
jgi:hypothetical protein